MRRALIVQQEPVHEEVIPSLRQVLRANDVETRLCLDRGIERRGDLFGTLTDFGDEVTYVAISGTDEGWPEVVRQARDADFVVFNTFQLNGHARQARRLGKPLLGLVHNPRLFVANPECGELVRGGGVVLATLAPHATADLMAHDPVLFKDVATLGAWMVDVPESLRLPPLTRPRITVPGAVDYRNRDFHRLVDLTASLAGERARDFEIGILGGGQDREALHSAVAERGLEDVFHFAPVDPANGQVGSGVLYPELARSTFVLPLLPPQRVDYRRWKISAALSSSLAYSVPALLDRFTATTYGLPCVQAPLGEELSGLRTALAMEPGEYAALRAGLDTARQELQERSVAEAARALAVLEAAGPLAAGAPRSPVQITDRDAFLDFARQALPQSHSQRFQDLFALWCSGGAATGWFVEFGAVTGVGQSNSYLLERLGWQGVVAEPNPEHWAELTRNRTCSVSTKCVYVTSGDTVTFHAVTDRPALSTIAGFGDADGHAGRRQDYVEHRVETVTLSDLLVEAGAPSVLDFLSIDTEGSELEILRAHDFDRFRFRCVAVEHNGVHRDELLAFFRARGYLRLWPELSGHDDWYVLREAYPDWDHRQVVSRLTDVQGVEAFAPAYDERVQTMRTFLDRDAQVAPLPPPAGRPRRPDDVAAAVGRLAGAVPEAAAVRSDLQLRRFRRLFRELTHRAASDGVLVLGDEPDSLPRVEAATVGRLSYSELGPGRASALAAGHERLSVWSKASVGRRLMLASGTLWRHVAVAALDAPTAPEEGEWGEEQLTRALAERGLVLVATAPRGADLRALLYVEEALLAKAPVALALARAWAAPEPDDDQKAPGRRGAALVAGLRKARGRQQ